MSAPEVNNTMSDFLVLPLLAILEYNSSKLLFVQLVDNVLSTKPISSLKVTAYYALKRIKFLSNKPTYLFEPMRMSNGPSLLTEKPLSDVSN